jgi:fatty-acyl-CoA synthase
MAANPWQRLAGATALARAIVRPERADRLPRAMLAAAPWGATLPGIVAAASARYPTAPAVVDDDGTLSYAELWGTTDALASGLRDRGIGPGSAVGILCGNHRVFVQAMVAAAKVGADVVFLNTGFAGPQLADVAASEDLAAVLHDDELADVARAAAPRPTLSSSEMTSIALRRTFRPVSPTRRSGRVVILTSGTTGRPKGAARSTTGGLDGILPLLVIPMRARDTVVVAPPLFHAWGLAHLGFALARSSTVVLRRRFDAAGTVAAVTRHRAAGLVVVPVMLQRILALGDDLRRFDVSCLRYLATSGSALGATTAREALERFGPVVYNLYGSTEVSVATIATPDDLQADPATVGRPPPGSVVRVVDDQGADVPTGVVGRIFVGNAGRFEGYTGGGGKEVLDGLISTGDVGHFDAAGRLFVDGRDDEMIVSGGENVYPAEVEDLLLGHPAVAEAAVVGVPDAEFGQRLRAHVVRRPGSRVRAETLQAYVREHLARYKVPREIVFVEELPRTTTGKLRKRDLA